MRALFALIAGKLVRWLHVKRFKVRQTQGHLSLDTIRQHAAAILSKHAVTPVIHLVACRFMVLGPRVSGVPRPMRAAF